MSKKTTIYDSVTSGILTRKLPDKLLSAVIGWSDGRIKITIEKLYRQRSTPQNAYYWGVIICEFCDGYTEMTGEKITKDQAHEFLKHRFNSKDVANKLTGEVITIPLTTSELTTSGFMDYQAECIRFIAEFFGRFVPEPGEQLEITT